MTLADLCALVVALPDDQLIDVLVAAGVFESNTRVAEAWSRELKAKHAAQDDLASEREAHERTKAEWKRWADVVCSMSAPASRSFMKRPDEEP
jgi:hypothetical protein